MTSRLDRLFLLLDQGSSYLTRKAAAIQLGEVQKLHPHELHNLLAKVKKYLYSSSWDTRIAAGQAVEAIINNVPQWNPQGCVVKKEPNNEIYDVSLAGRMKFSEFNINKVMENGKNLLACESNSVDIDEHLDIDPQEHLAKQREMLNKHLGLSFSSFIGIDSNYLSNEDFEIRQDNKRLNVKNETKASVLDEPYSPASRVKLKSSSQDGCSNPDSKQIMHCSQNNVAALSNGSEPITKKRRLGEKLSDDNSVDLNSNSDSLWEESKQWPFESFSDGLVSDLFNPSWGVRHGAATALREIVRIHGRGAGRKVDVPASQMEFLNQIWLEDLALRLICVLALDKFGDFISDQVIAPVRETCAQVLGVVISIMLPEQVEKVLTILLQLLVRPEWEARHGGLLGLKYILSVRKDLKTMIIPLVFDPVCICLKDSVDDVSAVAASALVPVANVIANTLPEKVSSVISSLWDALLDLDDLTVSTSSILELLASLLSYTAKSQNKSLSLNFEELIPRLWPFLGHNSSIVRKSVLQALIILTSDENLQPCCSWVPDILQPALRLLFQRCLIEPVREIHDLLYIVWRNLLAKAPLICIVSSTVPFLSSWLSMIMHPQSVPIDPNSNSAWLDIPHKIKEKTGNRSRNVGLSGCLKIQEFYYIGGNESINENSKEREKNVMRAKLTAAKFIGLLISYLTKPVPEIVYPEDSETPLKAFVKLVGFHLNYKSALQRLAISLVLSEWAASEENNVCPSEIKEKCLECLNETVYFDEIAVAFTRLQQEFKDFVSILKHYSVPVDAAYQSGAVYTFEQIVQLASVGFPSSVSVVKLKPKVIETLEERRKSLLKTVTQTSHDQAALNVMVQSAIAGALVSLKYLPEKLNPIIRPLMDSIKREENELLQVASAHHLVNLMELCISRNNCPNLKIIKNLVNFLCFDVINMNFINEISPNVQNNNVHGDASNNHCKSRDEILTLSNMQKSAERAFLRRSNSIALKKGIVNAQCDETVNDEIQRYNELQAQGATYVLTFAAQHFGSLLPEKLPKLWESIFQPLRSYVKADCDILFASEINLHELLSSLQVLKVICSHLHKNLHSELKNIIPLICSCLEHTLPIVRHKAAGCLGSLSKVMAVEIMNIILDKVISKLGATDNDVQRQGAVEAIACIIDELGLDIVPYIIFLIVPMLGRMSDQNDKVRLLATHCFASLIKLMPLEGGVKSPENLDPSLLSKKEKERLFLEQLMNPKKVEPYKVPVPVKAELRSYQQEGVNWLAFLNKYKLHGILCDDMGLGKTLQSICILAGDHYLRDQLFKETKSADCKPLPSLVVCPPTLTGHWIYEVEKFVSLKYLNPIHYTGPPAERQRLRSKVKKYNLVIASYDIVRNDIDFFGTIHWNYCILDEGHIIKNGKTKLARAIKQLSANHRLILSGTPIQNNVLELWSLFDFLMPGFLGTEKQFTARYSKPILQSRDAKSSSKEQEIGVLAMESLHRQVLPFLLRRMKEDVLKDLPPKIIQDYYCELSPLQVQLYEDFAKSRARQSVQETIVESETPNAQGTSHVFQALQYLRKVCNHPKLVLSSNHPQFEVISKQLKEQNSSLQDVNHAAKLCALRQLLQDCGIGASITAPDQDESTPVVNQHRALVFCQLKSMLDILEKDLLKSLMPSVSYLRLDGSIPPGMRHSVVHRFNNDPSIDVLLLTTQVGGLGLNLTGADTVIFVEHDWNPMKDLQAMDRAHRIGQKKVVNVYRLITRGTLEEKIMGLQKFKLSVANSVINQENTSLQNMGTDQLLDLFTLDNKGEKIIASSNTAQSDDVKMKGMKSVLDNLPELWDTSQYETEYDLTNFLNSLK
ncbi:TATA-binding protein-associated factor 172-like [Uloborus diversus]|uniref:TATA-binding protein-associated factor 172-like n=1 Tax=Uloborus diversus TaxID=327109 RepID=UPI00240A65E9|nr:TATA-binding protein-associated factor 172-like [Uloborus diversus]